jgi:hypothetical protein
MINKELIYLQLSVREPEEACQFLVKYLGFSKYTVPGKKVNAERQAFLVCNRFGNSYLLTPVFLLQSDEEIIVNTDDCLRDYCQLNLAGLKFEKKPQYTSDGLEVKIIDHNGNKYKLLEKRDYTEE